MSGVQNGTMVDRPCIWCPAGRKGIGKMSCAVIQNMAGALSAHGDYAMIKNKRGNLCAGPGGKNVKHSGNCVPSLAFISFITIEERKRHKDCSWTMCTFFTFKPVHNLHLGILNLLKIFL